MFGPTALTHVVYVILVVVFVAVVSYMVIYNIRQKAKLKETGANPSSVAEEIVIEREQTKRDEQRR